MNVSTEDPGTAATTTADIEFVVEGMMCQKNCANTVRDSLIGVSGVRDAEVSFASKEAKVWLNDLSIDINELVDTIEVVGYDVIRKIDHRPPSFQHHGSKVGHTLLCMCTFLFMSIQHIVTPAGRSDISHAACARDGQHS
jgi:copper chaperone CopZ